MSILITFNNGVEISVGASEKHYCLPRKNNSIYTHIELCHTSAPLFLKKYACPLGDSIYAYVPSGVIRKLILHHGGVKQGRMPTLR